MKTSAEIIDCLLFHAAKFPLIAEPNLIMMVCQKLGITYNQVIDAIKE